jgi:uncharacterized protein (DUF305 family)
MRRPQRAGLYLINAVLVVGGVAACNDDTGQRSDAARPVIVPGRPGEPAHTATPGERVGVPASKPNAADVMFVQMMVPHHQQALEMTGLIEGRARSRQVRGIAARIDAAQRPEISYMQSWLRGNAKSAASGMSGEMMSEMMPGMATPQQMAQLRAASGKKFDRLFLKLMITHHQGAVTMATTVLSGGSSLAIQDLAREIMADQSAEIRRMQGMR